MCGGGRWAARVGLNPSLRPFRLPMNPRSASYRPKLASHEMSHYHWGQFQTHAFHVAHSIGPIVSVVSLYGWQNSL